MFRYTALTLISAACVLSGCAKISNLTTLSQAPAPVGAADSTPAHSSSAPVTPAPVQAAGEAAASRPDAAQTPVDSATQTGGGWVADQAETSASPSQETAGSVTTGQAGDGAAQAAAANVTADAASQPAADTPAQTDSVSGAGAGAGTQQAAAGSLSHPIAAPGSESANTSGESATTPAADATQPAARAATGNEATATATGSDTQAKVLAGSEVASAPQVLAGPAVSTAPTTPAPGTPGAAATTDPNAPPFTSGPTRITVAHIVTKADDGSKLTLTVDGTDAGTLGKGEKRELYVSTGKHKVGGYVKTLFGYGRVTIDPVDVTTRPGRPVNVTYSVTRNKPTFTLQKSAG